jgi:hypothetical protein
MGVGEILASHAALLAFPNEAQLAAIIKTLSEDFVDELDGDCNRLTDVHGNVVYGNLVYGNVVLCVLVSGSSLGEARLRGGPRA